MKTQIFQAILRESDRFGFEPMEPHWMVARGAAAVHEPGIPHFWWSEEVPFLVGFFTASEAYAFALTLERIANIRRNPQLDLSRSPFNELIELKDLSAVIDIARLGSFAWTPDGKGGMLLGTGITADTLTMLGNLKKFDPPGEPPEGCDLSERAEIRRLGAEPHTRAFGGGNSMEMTWWGWRAILCIFATQGQQPWGQEWLKWLSFYAYYDTERAHSWWNTGYLRISTLPERDIPRLKAALLKYLAQPDAILKRLQSFPATDPPDDAIIALQSVVIEEVRSVAELCSHATLSWTIYSDGIIVLTGQ